MQIQINLSPMKVTALVLAAFLGTACAAHNGKVAKLLAQVGQEDCDVTATATAPGLGGIDVDLDWCDCANELPDLGSGVQVSNSLNAQVNQLSSISSTPDVEQETYCNTNCCSCNQANAEARVNAQRIRRFCIEGDIQVTEDISFHELSEAVEASEGIAAKDSHCVLTNEGEEDLAGICIDDIYACPDGEEGLGAGRPGRMP